MERYGGSAPLNNSLVFIKSTMEAPYVRCNGRVLVRWCKEMLVDHVAYFEREAGMGKALQQPLENSRFKKDYGFETPPVNKPFPCNGPKGCYASLSELYLSVSNSL